MRLLIFTNRDLASNYFLNLILPRISPFVVQVFLSDKVGKPTPTEPPLALQTLKFFEQTLPNEILFPELEKQNRLLSFAKGSPVGSKKEGIETSDKLLTFNELSRLYDVPIVSLNDVRSDESLAAIAALNPDLVLSVRYGKIFGKAFLAIPRHGVINLHSGRLPQYRGVLAAFRAMQKGDTHLNGTLHYIEDGTIDTGGIIGFSETTVEYDTSLLSNILNLYTHSVNIVCSTIEKIAAHKPIERHNQATENAAYYSFPSHEELVLFEQRGGRFIDFKAYQEFISRYLF
jgi:methionyl-tRNA formyltransferase